MEIYKFMLQNLIIMNDKQYLCKIYGFCNIYGVAVDKVSIMYSVISPR